MIVRREHRATKFPPGDTGAVTEGRQAGRPFRMCDPQRFAPAENTAASRSARPIAGPQAQCASGASTTTVNGGWQICALGQVRPVAAIRSSICYDDGRPALEVSPFRFEPHRCGDTDASACRHPARSPPVLRFCMSFCSGRCGCPAVGFRVSPHAVPVRPGDAPHASSDGLIWPKDGCASIACAAMAAANYFPPRAARALHREAK